MTGTPASLPSLRADRARDLIARFPSVSIAIFGDVMLDQFVIGGVNRISPEAPVPVVEFHREEFRAGGAANVASNVHALGGRATLVGLAGTDRAGEQLLAELTALGIDLAGLVRDGERRTTVKMRIVTDRHQQVARVDYENADEPDQRTSDRLATAIERAVEGAGAVIVSDYVKGGVTLALMQRLLAKARTARVPVLVDPKIPHLDRYAGARLITPNHSEAEVATHMRIRTDDDARAAARALRARLGCESVLITRGEHGMWLLDGDLEGALRAVAREVSDVTGAGDTVIATLALAVAAGASLSEAAALANHAAGIVVGRFGPATLTAPELMAAVEQDD